MDANGVAVPFKLIDNKDKTYRVEFQTTVAGVCTATVMYTNEPATGSPYKITVESGVDLSKVQVNGLPESELQDTLDHCDCNSNPNSNSDDNPTGSPYKITVEPVPVDFVTVSSKPSCVKPNLG